MFTCLGLYIRPKVRIDGLSLTSVAVARAAGTGVGRQAEMILHNVA